MNIGTAQVIRANSRHLPLADNSVDLVVTSPPYFALRSYQDGGSHYAGQIGDEPTPAEFVDSLLEVTRECVRVLKPSGSLWVNLGDKYAGSVIGGQTTLGLGKQRAGVDALSRIGMTRPGSSDGDTRRGPNVRTAPDFGAVKAKSLIGIPWRYALRCIDDLGLILRAEVIWSKPNGLPESVTDRVRRSHEQWFHFVLNPRYFSAVDEIRETYAPGTAARYASGYGANGAHVAGQTANGVLRMDNGGPSGTNPLGKLPGSVWDITSGNTLVRDILDAVAAGALTADEGERLWTGASDSCDTLTLPATVGNGSDGRTRAVTARPHQTSSHALRTGRTESPTDSTSAPSLTDSPSITPAATSDASILPTSSPSLAPRTSAAPGLSETPAPTDTRSQTPTVSARGTASSPSGVGPATSPESTHGDSVWRIPTEPLRVPEHLGIDHFAAFPTEFPKRIISGWSPSGICTACGEGRRPVVATDLGVKERDTPAYSATAGVNGSARHGKGASTLGSRGPSASIAAYVCACTPVIWQDVEERDERNGTRIWHRVERLDLDWVSPAPTTPAVVLDPFGGTGTTAMVAKALGRHGISVDMSSDYGRLAQWRVNDLDQLAKVQGIKRSDAAKAADDLDMDSLFDLGEPA